MGIEAGKGHNCVLLTTYVQLTSLIAGICDCLGKQIQLQFPVEVQITYLVELLRVLFCGVFLLSFLSMISSTVYSS